MIYLIIEILARFIDASILFTIILLICNPRSQDIVTKTLSFLVVCLFYTSAFLLVDRYESLSFISILGRMSLILALSFIICKPNHLTLQVLAMSTAVFMTFTLDCIIQFSLAMLIGHTADVYSSLTLLTLPGMEHSLLLLMSKAIQCVVLLLLHNAYTKLRSLSKESMIILSAILLLGNIISVYLVYLILSWSEMIWQFAVILSWLFITISVSAAMITVLVANGLQKERIEHDMMMTMNEAISNTYEALISKNEELKKQAHDFSHHLSAIRRMDKNLIDSYITEILGKQKDSEKTISSGDPYVDAVINGKLALFTENNIRFSFHVLVPTKLPFPAPDICSIVSNQLDNAIEACKKITDIGSRWIEYTIDRNNSFVTMICKNSIATGSIDMNSSLISTKARSSLHGFGIRNIQTCAERNHGILTNDIKSTSFSSNVILEIE